MSISESVKKNMVSGSFIRKMFEEGIALKKIYGNDAVFDLTIGNPIMEPPAEFKTELKRLAENPLSGMHRYMENAGYPETRNTVAQQLSQETRVKFNLNAVVMTVGTAGALNTVLKALLNPGEEVLTFAPYFFEYASFVDNHGGVIKILPSDDHFMPDFAALEAGISAKTKALIINSPNNPTGAVYSREVLKKISAILTDKSAELNKRLYIITDDVYSKIYYGEGKCPRVVDYYPHSIIVSSFSKDLSLPGERIGYAAVHPDCEQAREVVDGIIYANRVLGFVNAPALMQRAITNLHNCCVSIDEYRRKRDLLCDNLAQMGYALVRPQGAFYIFPRSPIPDDVVFMTELKQLKVLVVPGSAFHAPGHFRISYCLDDKTLSGSLEGFRQVARKYFKKS
jgi:aspartate aminotransferase